jgi:hypothetical protein
MKPCLERILEKFGYISMDPWSIFFPGTGLGIRGMGSAEPSTVLKCAGSAGSGLWKTFAVSLSLTLSHSLEMPRAYSNLFRKRAQDMSHEWALLSVASSPNMSCLPFGAAKQLHVGLIWMTRNVSSCGGVMTWQMRNNWSKAHSESIFDPQTLQAKPFDEHLHLHHTCSMPKSCREIQQGNHHMSQFKATISKFYPFRPDGIWCLQNILPT